MTALASDHFVPLGSVTAWLSGGTPDRSNAGYWSGAIPWISATTLKQIEVSDSDQKVTAGAVRAGSKMAPVGSTLLLVRGSALHSEIRASIVTSPVCFNQDVKALVPTSRIVPRFLTYTLHANANRLLRLVTSAGNTAGVLDTNVTKRLKIYVPERSTQERLVRIFDDVESEIISLERLIAKQQAIKQGKMQQLLTGKTRLPGFTQPWATIALNEAATILDNLRVPLSADQRVGRSGPFPYCGANGVLDHIDDYMIDDDVILLAEDGGNFDQWRTRPIAYRMKGKIWVNNHAHVLKGAANTDTGFLFSALEHKDITPYISSGTRTKLTRGELVRIKIDSPQDLEEQQAIAVVMRDADQQIRLLRSRLTKALDVKQGMMQELLTGHTRLPVKEGAA